MLQVMLQVMLMAGANVSGHPMAAAGWRGVGAGESHG